MQERGRDSKSIAWKFVCLYFFGAVLWIVLPGLTMSGHAEGFGGLTPMRAVAMGIYLSAGAALFYVLVRQGLEGVRRPEAAQEGDDRTQQTWRESEEGYRVLVESCSDGIGLVGKGRILLSCNRAFSDLFGYERSEIEGRSVRFMYPSQESFEAFGQMAYPVLEEKNRFRIEWDLARRDGTIFPGEVTLSAVRDANGSIEGFVGFVRDITAQKQAEEELERHRVHLEELIGERTKDLETAHQALIQKEKLKTLGAISAQVAHQIRNPLVSIGGFARRLEKQYPDLPEARIIVQESARLEKLLDRISDYLKPVRMSPRECAVNTVVTECLDLLLPELESRQARVRLNLCQDLHAAYVDPGVLNQVMVTLIRNMLKATDVSVTVAVATYETGQSVHVEFRVDIPEHRVQDLETSYLPFDDTGKSVVMPVSYRLLRNMGGMLSVSRQDNELVVSISLRKTITADYENEGIN